MTEPTDKRLGSPTHSEAEQERARPSDIDNAPTNAGELMEALGTNPIKQAVAQERARVVAWLLRHFDGELSANQHVQRAAYHFASAISLGDHLKGVE